MQTHQTVYGPLFFLYAVHLVGLLGGAILQQCIAGTASTDATDTRRRGERKFVEIIRTGSCVGTIMAGTIVMGVRPSFCRAALTQQELLFGGAVFDKRCITIINSARINSARMGRSDQFLRNAAAGRIDIIRADVLEACNLLFAGIVLRNR